MNLNLNPLFADTSTGDGKLAIIIGVSTILGGAGQYVIGKLIDLRKENREAEHAKEQSIVTHQKALIERLDAEKRELEREKAEAEREREKCTEVKHAEELTIALMRRHIRYIESILTRVGTVSFEPWADDAIGPVNNKPKTAPKSDGNSTSSGNSTPSGNSTSSGGL
jgi:hypothetical protein